MLAPLSIAAAQPETLPHDIAVNALRHAEAITEAGKAGARLVVFPELSLTGYEYGADPLDMHDARLEPIARACETYGAVALVGAPVADEHGAYIAMICIDATSSEVVYRKQWLADDEARHFIPGPCATAIELDGWRVGVGICKDTGTPQHVADVAALDIDLYVAGILFEPAELDKLRTRGAAIARACQAPVALASFAGATGEGYHRTLGTSTIWSSDGEPITSTDQRPGRIVSATFEPRTAP